MRCSDCKHWGEPDVVKNDWEDHSVGTRICTATKERWRLTDGIEYSEHDNGAEWVAARKRALIEAQSYVADGSDYIAKLITGPEFFCAKFEKRSD